MRPPAVVEALENRRLLAAQLHHGIVDVDCGRLNDVVVLSVVGDQLTVNVNGSEKHFARADVHGIHVSGGKGDDMIEASNWDHEFDIPVTLLGGAGHDTLTGGEGNDLLRGMDGDDFLFAGGGSDVVRGGAGNDLLTGESGNDRVFGGRGDDLLGGGEGDDIRFAR